MHSSTKRPRNIGSETNAVADGDYFMIARANKKDRFCLRRTDPFDNYMTTEKS
ncbi:MAG TPA: hypothetical protein VM260_28310 [Pirellula sp.]|nr:hypothetical protein [Pirellula sp.]